MIFQGLIPPNKLTFTDEQLQPVMDEIKLGNARTSRFKKYIYSKKELHTILIGCRWVL